MRLLDDARLAWRLARLLLTLRRKLSMLPDKKATQSAAIWGAAIKAIGLIIGAIGAAVGAETSWSNVLTVAIGCSGAFVALVGMLIGDIGQRRATGEAIRLSRIQLRGGGDPPTR